MENGTKLMSLNLTSKYFKNIAFTLILFDNDTIFDKIYNVYNVIKYILHIH